MIATWCQTLSLTVVVLNTPATLPRPKPILPVALIAPHWMSLPPPACSLPITAGESHELLLPDPVCVVLIQKLSELVPINGAVVAAPSATWLPAPSKRSAVPEVPMWPVAKTGSTAGLGVESLSVPLRALYLSTVVVPVASSKVQRPTGVTASVGVGALLTGTTVTSTLAVSVRPPDVTVYEKPVGAPLPVL